VIRVLRLLEYTFADAEAAQLNMDRWTHNLNLPRMTMRSAQITDLAWVLAPEGDKEVKHGSQSDSAQLQGREGG
jgi:hypothetical protein